MIFMRQPVHALLRGLRIGEKKNTGRKADGDGEKKVATAFLAVSCGWLRTLREKMERGEASLPSLSGSSKERKYLRVLEASVR